MRTAMAFWACVSFLSGLCLASGCVPSGPADSAGVRTAQAGDAVEGTPLPPSSSLQATALSPWEIGLAWLPVPEATTYRVYAATDGQGPWKLLGVVRPPVTQFFHRGLEPRTKYHYLVTFSTEPCEMKR